LTYAVVDVLDHERQARDPVGRSPQRGQEYDLGWDATDLGRARERMAVHTLHVTRVGGTLAADQHAVGGAAPAMAGQESPRRAAQSLRTAGTPPEATLT
jgi:hypothetical protein